MYSGSVTSLWRYPVKSLRGEKLDQLELDERGVVSDRGYAIYDKDGKQGSGKNTRRFRRIDGLIDLSASLKANELFIHFPDGRVISQRDANCSQYLSDFLGQKVELKGEQAVPHFDQGATHIITTTMLDKLNDLLPEAGVDERRFRPTLSWI